MRYRLEITDGPEEGRVFTYEGYQAFVVGRSARDAGDTLIPSDPYMSRHHFRLVLRGRACYLQDLDSKNGVKVDGKRVAEAVLQGGETIKAGRTRMRLVIEGGGEASGPITIVPEDAQWTLEQFERIERIDSGGAAEVYRARHLPSGRTVALKMLELEPGEEPVHVRQFLREMAIASRLKHRHIVSTLSSGLDGDMVWLASRWIQGRTLEQRVADEGPLTEEDVIRIGEHLLLATGYAHAEGFIHRDIKPANILHETDEGEERTLLTDFGLAKAFPTAGAECLTRTGHMKGTPRYMPPEQVLNARGVGPAADLFAVGACLYHALTGAWHYDASQRAEWSAILRGPLVPLHERRRDLDPRLAEVIERALAPEAADRHRSAGAMHEALRNAVPA
ncbi:MAG: protein kinase domain-containing protein [Planctomycetota bacterium]|jgi:serine/threonine protein kinase